MPGFYRVNFGCNRISIKTTFLESGSLIHYSSALGFPRIYSLLPKNALRDPWLVSECGFQYPTYSKNSPTLLTQHGSNIVESCVCLASSMACDNCSQCCKQSHHWLGSQLVSSLNLLLADCYHTTNTIGRIMKFILLSN